MAESNGATARLGAFVAGCTTGVIPRGVAEAAAIRLLDAIGLAIVARDERTFRAMRALVAPLAQGPAVARIWTDGTPASVSEAVTANAIAVHAQFHDDCDMASWTHPGSLIVPAAVGAGEATKASLDRVLRAVAAGYATIAWLGAKERVARALIERGIRTSPTLGTIAAAAASAVALGLDETQATHAIGMATSITGGVLEPVRAGSDEWRVQNAHAARGGLLAAQLAQRGVLGAAAGLEGPKGFARSLAGLADTPLEWREPPRLEAIFEAWAKPWATLGDNVAAVAAARLLYEQKVNIAGVRRIGVRIWRHFAEYPGTSYRGPYERTTQALASTAFAVAAMLTYGRLDYALSLDHRDDPRILRLVERITVEPEADGTPYDATVEIELADGSTVRRTARESPRTLLFHDRKTAVDVLDTRLSQAGCSQGAGPAVAAAVFEAVDQGADVGIGAMLDRLHLGDVARAAEPNKKPR